MANELTYQSEFTGQQMDAKFTAVGELTAALEALTAVVAQKYVKPTDGIPATDMDADVQAALAKALTAVQSLADYYTKAEMDALLAAINAQEYVDVSSLPTASASTMGKIYLVGPDGSGYYSYYISSYDGSAYSWVGPLGTTEISLANYATKAELSQLDQEVEGLDETVTGWESGYIKTSLGVGETCTMYVVPSNSYQHVVIAVNSKYRYVINGTGGYDPRLWAFLDAGDKILSASDSAVIGNDLVIYPPIGATQLIINRQVPDSTNCYIKYDGVKQDMSKLDGRIDTLEGRIDTLEGKVEVATEYGNSNLVSGYWNMVAYFNTTMPNAPASATGWSCLNPIAVTKGDKITVKTLGGGNGRAWGFADVNNKLYARADANVDTQDNGVVLTAPQDGYLYVNYHSGTASKPLYVRHVAASVEILDKRIADTNKVVDSILSYSAITPRMFNPKTDFRKQTLKVLEIGNSFTTQALKYVSSFAEADNLDLSDMCVYGAIYGGGTFKDWYDVYHDDNQATYNVTKLAGGLSQTISGTADAGDGSKFRGALKDVQWDIIMIHQSAAFAAESFDDMEGTGAGGYLKELVRIIRTLQPSAAIGFLFAHVSNMYSPEIEDSTKRDTASRFADIAEVTKTVCGNYGIDFVVPVGAAVENLRASSLNTTNYNFSKDNHHLADGLGIYVASAAYYQALFGARYGKTVYGNSFDTRAITESDTEDVGEAYMDDFVAVTSQNAPVAQMCAVLAVNDIWGITDPDEIDL